MLTALQFLELGSGQTSLILGKICQLDLCWSYLSHYITQVTCAEFVVQKLYRLLELF